MNHNTLTGESVASVQLKPRKARPFFGRHPWVLQRAIDRVIGEPSDGDVVDVRTDKGQFIARGIYNSRSRIAVRLYSWDADQPLDEPWWADRIQRAATRRFDLGLAGPDRACRLVYSEADGLSGLIVDRYGAYLVVQISARAVAARQDMLREILVQRLQPAGMIVRVEGGIAAVEGMEAVEDSVWGDVPESPIEIQEHGIRYAVDLRQGQKTGMYLDQRDNRRVAAGYLQGRRVLDLFCYSGGFSLNAVIHGQAEHVLGIDSSAAAIGWAQENARRNGVGNVEFQQGKAFQVLDRLQAEGARFDAVILDPPKFSKNRFGVSEALRAYHRINRVGLDLLNPGGILVTCSCSGGVTREDFMLMLAGVAEKSSRDLQVLEQRGAAPDHPVSPTCLENEYLKCFICLA